ncbi:hypothetical protein GCM10023169_37690 [Georgenia halophila]|uniref:Uncharacterized protein n=1 Tax=Georgenia halophila TaxID=620889 RepID=A0ABP8LNL5_9MICO
MSEPTTRRKAQNPTVYLALQATDAPALTDYHVNTFGFVVAARYEDDGVVQHAQLA